MKIILLVLISIFYVGQLLSQQWTSIGSGLEYPVNSMVVFNSNLYVASDAVYSFNTDDWTNASQGMYSLFGAEIYALGIFNGDFYAGGTGFYVETPDHNWYNNVARLNEGSWTTCGSGTGNDGIGMGGNVNCLLEYGGQLYAGGNFGTAGGDPLNPQEAPYIASFNGSQWNPVGGGMNDRVTDLAVYNGNLIASGFFTVAGGTEANYIALWNGSVWSPLGSGMDGKVTALAVYNGELYAGGLFENAGGTAAQNIAKWNGTEWSAVGSGITEQVYTLAVFEDKLYAGGTFRIMTGNSGDYIMSWDGNQWNAVGSGTDGNVICLLPDPSGLYVGGYFNTAGGIEASNIARYITSTEVKDNSKPSSFTLSQNYPNPFNPVTKIKYSVSVTGFITINVYDIPGNIIATLVNERVAAGNYEVEFDASGMNLSSGVYLVKIMNDQGNRSSVKMMLLK